jgi:hypothetical protein
VPRLEGKSVVTSKWVYKIKHAVDGNINNYKARFMARGFSQQEGEDYDETFALVARYTSIRAIISLAASMGWSLHQMDVRTAFLNGVIEEEVYIKQPQGFEVHPRETHVCKLKKALYGLKQAPRVVEFCTLGGVPHVLMTSLAHERRTLHFVPCTFV